MKSKRRRKREESLPPQKSTDSLKGGIFSKGLWSSPTGHLILLVIVMGLGILVRLAFLSADPPLDLSWSQDVNTDPGQYTSFARSKVLMGEWDPFGIPFLVLWLNSAYTLISFLFFKFLGVGRFQTNLVAASLSVLTLVFFYLAIKRGVNRATALLATGFLGVNYILVMYSRNTFTEVQVIFFIVLGIYLLALGLDRSWFLIYSGACFAVSILFGKMLAVFILPACLGVLAVGALDEFSAGHRKVQFSPILFFAAGFLVVVLSWYFLIYSPSAETVSEFVSVMSVGMYGSPQALGSVSDFFYSLFSFGGVTRTFLSENYRIGTDLFFRMPFIFILSFLFLLGYFFKVFRAKSIFKNLTSSPKLELFFALWLVVGILALMPWNYRPLRYQILVIPPMCALTAFCLLDFLNPPKFKKKAKSSLWFWIFPVPLGSFLIFHTISFFFKVLNRNADFELILVLSFLLSLPLAYVFYAANRKKPSSFLRKYKVMGAALAVFLIFFFNGKRFVSFAQNVQYSFLRASEDLGQILGPEAVISGPYAQTLTLDNKVKLMLRMFAGWPVDPDLFQKFPLTHLAMEAKGGQREQASRDYPQVMENAKLVGVYSLRNFQVQILRVAESSGNPETENYRLSDYEKAKLLLNKGEIDSAVFMLDRFVSQHPRNFSGYVSLAEIHYVRKDFEKAASFLTKAARFDPTNSMIHQLLGLVYLNLYSQKGGDTYRLLAIKEWERALKLFPQNEELSKRLKEIRGG
jgi:4-amino-4-deoxy-L-arabinose transferase-like glycosyltransferase